MQVHLTGWKSSDGREWVAVKSGYNSAFITELKREINTKDRTWLMHLAVWLVRPSKAMVLDRVVKWAWGGAHVYCTECTFSHACGIWEELNTSSSGHTHPITGVDHGWTSADSAKNEQRRGVDAQVRQTTYRIPFDASDLHNADFQRFIDEFLRRPGAFGGFRFTGRTSPPPPRVPPPPTGEFTRAAALLGVNINASPEEVKKAAKRLAFENHPDRGGDLSKLRAILMARDLLLPKKE